MPIPGSTCMFANTYYLYINIVVGKLQNEPITILMRPICTTHLVLPC